MKPRIGCAVLAAGRSARLGRPKQLVVFEGAPLVRRAVDAARASACDDVAVIVGAYASRVSAAVAGSGAEIVPSLCWREGIGASIRAAAFWAIARAYDALLLAVCDQPRLSRDHLDALLRAWTSSSHARSVASAYSGVLGVPALFPALRFAELASIEGARGASALLRERADVAGVPWPDGAIDVDTTGDLDELQRASGHEPSSSSR